MAHTDDGKPASLTWTNYLSIMFFMTVHLSFACFQTILAPFIDRSNGYNDKPLKRRIGDTIIRASSFYLPTNVMQCLVGSGLHQYQRWVKNYKPELGALVEELPFDSDRARGERGRLFWIGPKRTEKVLLYLPGGAYMFQVTEMMLKFWRYAQVEWERQGLTIGIVVLSYSVGSDPNAAFPVQLFQATQALQYLLSIGCNPSNIQIAGDSAGGNLITQLLSHMVHPFPLPSLVPPLNLPPGSRLRGVYMMSPWVGLSNPDQWGPTFRINHYDVTNIRGLGEEYVDTIFIDFPDKHSQIIPYAESVSAPDDWFSDLQNTVVDRILVTAGKEERLLDQIQVFFKRKIKPYHSDAVLLVQDGGIHDDMIMDFAVANAPLGNELSPVVLEWIAKGFRM